MATLNPNTGEIRITKRELGLRKRPNYPILVGKSPEADWNIRYGWLSEGIFPVKKLTVEQLQFLRRNMPAAHAAIQFLKSRMISLNYRIKKKDGRPNNLSDRRVERVMKLLREPNQYGHTFRQVEFMWLDNLLEFDYGAIEKAVGLLGTIDQIGALDTRYMRPNVLNDTGLLDPNRAFVEHEWDDQDEIVNAYKQNSIIWGNLNPQAKSFYGFSPLEVLHTIITMSINADQHNLKIVAPSSEKGGGIVWLGDIDDKVRKEFEARYDEFRRNDPGRPLFTGSGEEPKFLSFEDSKRMDWEKLQYRLAEIVVSCYGLNLRDVGIQSQHGSAGTAEIDDLITLRVAIVPRMLILTDILNVGLIEPAGGDDLEIEFMTKVQEPLEKRVRSASMAVGRGMMTMNEARDLLDLTLEDYPKEYGDEPFVMAGNQVLLLKDIAAGKVPAQNPLGVPPNGLPDAMPDGAPVKPGDNKPGADGKPTNFKRTTAPQNDRGVNQNWQ